jgi:hypothetical protein
MSSELRVVQVTHSPIASCATVSATAVGAACSAHWYQDVVQYINSVSTPYLLTSSEYAVLVNQNTSAACATSLRAPHCAIDSAIYDT